MDVNTYPVIRSYFFFKLKISDIGLFLISRTFINTNFMRTEEQDKKGYWTFPYYSCPKKSWTISYVTTIFSTNKQ